MPVKQPIGERSDAIHEYRRRTSAKITSLMSYVIYLTYRPSQLRQSRPSGMERAMKSVAILVAIWLGMFFGLSRAARYPAVWAAVGATAMTCFVGIYVFWVDWHPPLH